VTTTNWIVTILFTSVGLGGVIRGLPRLWRHDVNLFDRRPSWWPWGDRSFEAWRRALPAGALAGAGMGLGTVLLYLPPFPRFSVPQAIATVLILATLVLMALALSTAVVGRPRGLIFPWLRDDRPRPSRER
jgi:hypothetical protein